MKEYHRLYQLESRTVRFSMCRKHNNNCPLLSPTMATLYFDHMIIPSRDTQSSARFYEEIFGFEDLGEFRDEGLRGIRINSTTILFLMDSDSSPWSQGLRHYAFSTSRKKFNQIFANLKASGIPYGDNWTTPDNMKGPSRKRRAPGAKGKGETVYFKDPNDNLLQIITY
jgi:catechol 2,3-dioxygenase-like lactoylglutathione lyase family enzyme